MNIITANKENTIGIVSDVQGLKNLGKFTVKNLRDWLQQVDLVLGDDDPVYIHFKLSENPGQPGYMITACHDDSDPKVAVLGMYPTDGKGWCDK